MESLIRLAIIRTLDLKRKNLPLTDDNTLCRLKDRMTRLDLAKYRKELRTISREERAEVSR